MRYPILLLFTCCMAIAGLTGCGAKYQPMSQEKIEAKADSIFTADKAKYVEMLKAKCDSTIEANLESKINALAN